MTGQSLDEAARSGGGGLRGSLVLFPGALGDMVCLEPTVDRLAAEGPVRVLARGSAAEVAGCFPARPEVGSIDAREVASLFTPLLPGAPQAAVAVPAEFRGYQRLISFTGSRSREFRARWEGLPGAILCEFPAIDADEHASHRMLRSALADPLAWARRPRLRPMSASGSAVSGAGAREFPAQAKPPARPALVIHPGAGAASKRAPAELMRAAGEAWRAVTNGFLRVVLGPAEIAEHDAWQAWGGAVSIPGNVGELIEILAAADAYLGNDSGPSHVAAALNVGAGVVCYVSTAPCSFGPRGDRFEAWAVAPGVGGSAVLGSAIGRSLAESAARRGRALAPA